MKRMGRLSAITSTSIAKTKRFRYAKNRWNELSSAMYAVAYKWMRAPMPVMTSIITLESASTLKRTSIGTVPPERPPFVCIHSQSVQ